MEVVQYLLQSLVAGVADALKLYIPSLFFFTSKTVRDQTVQCFLLNGVIFLGSMFLGEWLIVPVMNALLNFVESGDSTAQLSSPEEQSILVLGFRRAWQVMILLPLYLISLLLNNVWYQDIAKAAFIIRGGKRNVEKFSSFERFVQSITQLIYKLLLSGIFLLQTNIMTMILEYFESPLFGTILLLLHLSWLHAWWSFGYSWDLQGKDIEESIQYFEERWAYFTGFGLPTAIMTHIFPQLIGTGIYAFLFPFFIILGIVANPDAHGSPPPGNIPIPVFRVSKKVGRLIIPLLGLAKNLLRLCKKSPATKGQRARA